MIKYFAGLTACFVAFCGFYAIASRNSSGTYSTPNTFVTGTSISSTAVNSNFSDIATEMTDSLDRSGKGGMLAAVRGVDGTVAAPAYSYTSETGSGSYRIGASDLGWAVAGAKKLELTSALFTIIPAASFNGTLAVGGVAGFNGVVATPAAAATARAASTATQSNITGAVGNNALAIESTHTLNNFLPGLIWYTSDNNPTIPKAGVYMKDTASGSVLNIGTSNNYATGITANTTIDQTGLLTAPGGVTVGSSGTAMSAVILGTTSWTPGAILTGAQASTNITTTGSTSACHCFITVPSYNVNVTIACTVGAGTTSVTLGNPSAGSLTPGAGTYKAAVICP